jgi:pimeloyl-ACP methyl ester carboxylesterase
MDWKTITASKLKDFSFVPEVNNDDRAAAAVDTYFTIPASRDGNINIPVGVTMPALGRGNQCPVALLIHGIGGSKDEGYGVYANPMNLDYGYVSLSERLLNIGIGTIRIDQPGHGDSNEDFRKYTIQNSLSDIRDSYDYCLTHFPFAESRVGVVGWSIGGKIGAEFVSENRNVSSLVLINPAASNGMSALAGFIPEWNEFKKTAEQTGKAYWRDFSVLIDKPVYLSKDFFEQWENTMTGDKIAELHKSGRHGLMIYGDKDDIINPETYRWICENGHIDCCCIPDMDHELGTVNNRPDQTNTVLNLTTATLNMDLAGYSAV